jgi:hypothetical protein
MADGPHYRVTLRPLPDQTPEPIRLRHFLKAALRQWGLRAVAVEEVPAKAPGVAPDGRGDSGQGSGACRGQRRGCSRERGA